MTCVRGKTILSKETDQLRRIPLLDGLGSHCNTALHRKLGEFFIRSLRMVQKSQDRTCVCQ